jgi:hypothetical protein
MMALYYDPNGTQKTEFYHNLQLRGKCKGKIGDTLSDEVGFNKSFLKRGR